MAVQPVIMPKLGAYTEDVLLAQWHAAEGDEVVAGTVVLEMETDKTTADVEAETSGWLHRLVAAGEKVPIGTKVGLVAETRAEYEALIEAGENGGREPVAGPAFDETHPFLGYVSGGGGDAIAGAVLSGPDAGSPERASGEHEAIAAPDRREGQLVSPRARALLARLGLSLDVVAEITGSGPGGRITDRDVTAWYEGRAGDSSDAPALRSAAGLTVHSTIPLRGRRGTIANRMVSSLQTAAQLTSIVELDVGPLIELRGRLNEAGASPRVGITSLVVHLVARALRNHRVLNSRVTETDVELLTEINVAVAVDTPDGLVAPVVIGADRLTLVEINDRITDLVTRARSGTLTPDDMANGTFTVSNGGIHPVDITTAILNPPQCGILWIGRIRDRPVVVSGGAIAVRPTLQACLTFDHRAVDGAPAAAFLGTLESLIAALPELPS